MLASRWQIREETREDWPAVRRVNEAAFGRPDEAELVDALRAENVVLVSLVADTDSEIAGHILFSRMSIDSDGARIAAVALAPMAVLPAHQRKGIGGELIREGLNLLRQRGEAIVIVLGHADYYPRFGFSSEATRALENPFPPDHYMAIELKPGALAGARGAVKYPVAFGL